jgi:hypothetical protein
MTDEKTISESEAEEMLRDFAAQKYNVFTFLNNIAKAEDTTKTGNLSKEELGTSQLPIRTYKELKLFCERIGSDKMGKAWAEYFKDMSEIQTSTSLSKEGFLDRLAVLQRKELADLSPTEKRKNSGWFKKKEDNTNNPQGVGV